MMSTLPYPPATLVWITFCLFLTGMSKGGLPVGNVALALMILIWPDESASGRSTVAFLLPVLCAMDIVALAFYRGHIRWHKLRRVMPGVVAGVALASAVFVAEHGALVSVSDQALKLCVGTLGLLFLTQRLAQRWILQHLTPNPNPGWIKSTVYGLAAGITSTLAHLASPVAIMYFIPQRLTKLEFAGTTAGFFFVLNLIKLVPFGLLGRLQISNMLLAVYMLPVVPLGVGAGYLAVRLLKPRHYLGLIYVTLFLTSVLLIQRALAGNGPTP